jgi:hypothetical protein
MTLSAGKQEKIWDHFQNNDEIDDAFLVNMNEHKKR